MSNKIILFAPFLTIFFTRRNPTNPVPLATTHTLGMGGWINFSAALCRGKLDNASNDMEKLYAGAIPVGAAIFNSVCSSRVIVLAVL